MKRAFTLLEALITIFIIALLAAILFPVLVSSKQAAVKTDDLAKLRQLGQAAAMYEDRYGEFPVTTNQVVAAGLVPIELCASSRDTSMNGIANDLAKYNQRRFSGIVRPTEVNYKSWG